MCTGAEGVPAVSLDLRAHALANISDGSLITDAAQNILYANAALCEMSGYSENELLGRNCRFLQGEASDPLAIAEIRDALAAGQTYRGNVLNYSRDGRAFWNSLTITAIRDEHGAITHYASVQRDVTELIDLQDEARWNATHDPLTRLPNRAVLEAVLGEALEAASATSAQVAVLYCDVDRFKLTNDALGHAAGDVMLEQDASQIRFYAGFPIETPSGERIGTLCVVDSHPRRRADDIDVTLLRELGHLVQYELERHLLPADGR